ncbi:MAG TPA: TlpA disulfide reductase family protein [Microvirga sp.]|nr:TlpA disulfide reductase family protein [Microvirga sp.]
MTVDRTPQLPPVITFAGPEGQALGLSDFKGKTILVNLWATWCVPCRQEMPALDKLQSELGGADFEVVAINVDTRNPEKPKAWLQENGIKNLAYYADPAGKLLQVLQKSGHVVGLPTTFVVDASGCEIAILKGPAEWASPDALAFIRTALGRS